MLANSRTLAEVAGESVRITKLVLWLLATFAAIALALMRQGAVIAGIGIAAGLGIGLVAAPLAAFDPLRRLLRRSCHPARCGGVLTGAAWWPAIPARRAVSVDPARTLAAE